MTSPQRTRLYFPAWRDAFRANWTAATPLRLLPQPANPAEARRIHRLARRIAGRSRPVGENDLRHAAHVVVLGVKKSSRDITNPELDLLLGTFRSLARPDGDTSTCRPHPLRSRASVVAPRPRPQHPVRAGNSASPAMPGRRLPSDRAVSRPKTLFGRDSSPCPVPAPSSPATGHRDFDPYATALVGGGPLGSTRTGD